MSPGPSFARAAPVDLGDAFDRYLGRGRPAFVEKTLPAFPRQSRNWSTRPAGWYRSPI